MKKTNSLLITFILAITTFIIMLSIYMKDSAVSRLKAAKDRTELLKINKEQIRLLKLDRCE